MAETNEVALAVMTGAYAAAAAFVAPTRTGDPEADKKAEGAALARLDGLAKDMARRIVISSNDQNFLQLVTDGGDMATFKATIIAVRREESSNRAVIYLKGKTTSDRVWTDPLSGAAKTPLPEGQEYIRTEKLDDGEEAMNIVKAVRDHVGYEALFTRQMQPITNPKPNQKGRSVRICRGVEILGPDPDYVAE